ncbi:2-hydroxychromene-2-carboxylate isomerase [Telmatospirillum sp. J64-1]|uniref:2-hydroxychromene-2-carboxylate isomerase n=1 Tax=Telmatospirillum sp. J64-1 TaxID=2502183 RepID=UPI00115D49C1|nr:2-hydroxychromene-2-carboxylate isomerase [Telmatospirillum sp. J64-1]
MAQAIDFYFDFSSPYGYFASHRIDEIAARHGRSVAWRPFMIGAAFKSTGQVPLLNQPMRGTYALHDWNRLARRWKVPFKMAEPFPFIALAASRGFYWIASTDPDRAKAFAKRVYHAAFGEGRPMDKPEVVVPEAEALGIARDDFLAAVTAPVWKDRLKAETERALERGAYGSPFFFVDDEPFWGNDRLEEIERWLETGGW